MLPKHLVLGTALPCPGGETVLAMPACSDRGVGPDDLRALADVRIQVHRDALAWR